MYNKKADPEMTRLHKTRYCYYKLGSVMSRDPHSYIALHSQIDFSKLRQLKR